VYRGDAPHDFAGALGNEILGFGVLEKRILRAREQCPNVPTQRRDPDRVPRVESIGQGDEAVEIGARTDRANGSGSPGDGG
jgi:hypothetical protein